MQEIKKRKQVMGGGWFVKCTKHNYYGIYGHLRLMNLDGTLSIILLCHLQKSIGSPFVP